LPGDVSFYSAKPMPTSYPGPVIWKLGNMLPGTSVTIQMKVYVFNWATDQFTNWVEVDTTTTDTNPDNDKDSEISNVGDPTAVTFIDFSAEAIGSNQVKVSWEYAEAVGIVAFKVLRAQVNDLKEATLVKVEDVKNDQLDYTYLDTVESPGTWYYWLVEVYSDGNERLPVDAVQVTVGPLVRKLFLPLIGR
jgi:hypothetical protein